MKSLAIRYTQRLKHNSQTGHAVTPARGRDVCMGFKAPHKWLAS